MSQRVTLDDTDLRARLRPPSHVSRPVQYSRRSVDGITLSSQLLVDVNQAYRASVIASKSLISPPVVANIPQPVKSAPTPPALISAPTNSRPAAPRQESSKVLMRQVQKAESAPAPRKLSVLKPTKSALLTVMAVVLFVLGVGVSFSGFHANTVAQAQAEKVSKIVDKGSATTASGALPPSTTPISAAAVAAYRVAADMPRYLKIPKIGVSARILQAGPTASGAVGTPASVYDTAWYTGSAKPGTPGAAFIDGHVSSWSSNGVFYNLKKLVAGDTLSVERGDGSVLNYKVVKTQVYHADDVDMAAALTSVDAAHPGLNLMTCSGKVKAGTNEFQDRIVVFTVQI